MLHIVLLLLLAPTAAAQANGDLTQTLRWIILALLFLGLVALASLLARGRGRTTGRFLDHLAELRNRVLVVITFLVAGMAFAFSFRLESWGAFWKPVPAIQDNLAAQLFDAVAADLVPPGVQLVVTRPMDGVMAQLTIALGIGILVALPVALWQGAAFVAPALRGRERAMLQWAILPALALFLLGSVFAYVVVLPFLMVTLYGYAGTLGAAPLLVVSEFMSFTVGLVVVFGLAFQTPLVMVVLAKAGVARASTYLRYWRHSLVGILVLSAFVTDPTIVSQVLVAVPLFGLYLLGAGVSRLVQPRAPS